MNVERKLPPFAFVSQPQNDWSLPQKSLKRKLGSSVPPRRRGEVCYPSPPMSSPPSPPQSAPELSIGAFSQSGPASSASLLPAVSTAPSLSAPPPTFLSTAPAAAPPQLGSIAERTSFGPPLAGPVGPQFPGFGVLHTGQRVTSVASAFSPSPVTAGPSSSRTGRKSKAHVASACINCKRAHLSCDVQRPCSRCIASGKQDTCYDVQHKKRGRPRLREEGDYKVEQMVPEQSTRLAVPPAGSSGNSRPIAATRHRRTDSLRSLRSQTSDSSSLPTPGFPPTMQSPLTLQSPFSYPQHPPPNVSLAPADIATAFLDVDLVILRANMPFRQVMFGGQDVRGRPLSDVAATADNESFQTIRNRLRAEREGREPSYLPPIVQSGEDPIQGVSEADIDRLTSGFGDYTYTWMRSQGGPSPETFPARVRLGKANAYFVAVTLPTFRPMSPQRPPMAPPFAVPTPPGLQPAHGYQPFATISPSSTQAPPMGPQTYPMPQFGMASQQQRPPSTSRLPTAEPPTETTPFAPPSSRESMPPPSSTPQLAPLSESPAVAAGPSEPRTTEGSTQRASSGEEEGDDRSPRKRRRMGIDDVLHR